MLLSHQVESLFLLLCSGSIIAQFRVGGSAAHVDAALVAIKQDVNDMTLAFDGHSVPANKNMWVDQQQYYGNVSAV